MKPLRAALRLAVLATAILFYLEPSPLGRAAREWLAASPPGPPEPITLIATDAPASALDAALILRATLRFEPKGLVFLDPITNPEDLPLLTSKLTDAPMPVAFTTNKNLPPLANVTLAPAAALPALPAIDGFVPPGRPAGCAGAPVLGRDGPHAVPSSVLAFLLALDGLPPAAVTGQVPGTIHAGDVLAPVNAAGHFAINGLALRTLQAITLDRLLVRTERRERGEIVADLDNLFRHRLIAVQSVGRDDTASLAGALALTALRNGFAEAAAPAAVGWLTVALAASLPWWPLRRRQRALAALGVAGVWLLLALGIYQEYRVALPLVPILFLPLLALLPRGADPAAEPQDRPPA